MTCFQDVIVFFAILTTPVRLGRLNGVPKLEQAPRAGCIYEVGNVHDFKKNSPPNFNSGGTRPSTEFESLIVVVGWSSFQPRDSAPL
jgi:hypothetical protein